ncbi:hypothetical protein EGW08_021960 [Elysia chlorotica]|uniref:Uncharacterized protein n=1 Tax=Elysia chlorotica TaxID=188477 RepID=A0A3S1AY67_ELYCH|nr:hypothetical protein EGW08_021960 [Elysia chlorotica]
MVSNRSFAPAATTFDALFSPELKADYICLRIIIRNMWLAKAPPPAITNVCTVCMNVDSVEYCADDERTRMADLDLANDGLLLVLFYSCAPITQQVMEDLLTVLALRYGLEKCSRITPTDVYNHFFLTYCPVQAATGETALMKNRNNDSIRQTLSLMHQSMFDIIDVDNLFDTMVNFPDVRKCGCNFVRYTFNAIVNTTAAHSNDLDEGNGYGRQSSNRNQNTHTSLNGVGGSCAKNCETAQFVIGNRHIKHSTTSVDLKTVDQRDSNLSPQSSFEKPQQSVSYEAQRVDSKSIRDTNMYRWLMLPGKPRVENQTDEPNGAEFSVNCFKPFIDCPICTQKLIYQDGADKHGPYSKTLLDDIKERMLFNNTSTAISLAVKNNQLDITDEQRKYLEAHFTDQRCKLNELRFIPLLEHLVKHPVSLANNQRVASLCKDMFPHKKSILCPAYHLAAIATELINKDTNDSKRSKKQTIRKKTDIILRKHAIAPLIKTPKKRKKPVDNTNESVCRNDKSNGDNNINTANKKQCY